MSKNTSFLGTGWSFPPTFTPGGQDIYTVSDAEDVQQSLDIILSTRLGERVMLEGFGCNLNQHTNELYDGGLINKIKNEVETAITEHERRITLDDVQVSQEGELEGILQIQLSYTIYGTNSRYNMVYPFYLDEATHPVTDQ